VSITIVSDCPKQLRVKELKSCLGTNYFGRQLASGDLNIFFPKISILGWKNTFYTKIIHFPQNCKITKLQYQTNHGNSIPKKSLGEELFLLLWVLLNSCQTLVAKNCDVA
jgi:hypothetical protein